jgi:hypothetical protein
MGVVGKQYRLFQNFTGLDQLESTHEPRFYIPATSADWVDITIPFLENFDVPGIFAIST